MLNQNAMSESSMSVQRNNNYGQVYSGAWLYLTNPCVIECQQVYAEMPIYLSNKIASECAMIDILKTMLQ